jgi:hypothetical protein
VVGGGQAGLARPDDHHIGWLRNHSPMIVADGSAALGLAHGHCRSRKDHGTC